MSERINQSPEHENGNAAEVEQTGAERRAELKEHYDERVAETRKEKSTELLKNDALEKAKKSETESVKAEKKSSPEKRITTPRSRAKAREANFKRTMSDARSHMSAPSRAFSKVIHAKAVERTSDAIGATVARPNALLSGAVAAFILTLVVYLVAKYDGYPLSGFESIAAFILGWVIGLLFDYLRVMITGKKV